LKDTHAGNTLCSPKFKVVIPEIEYPNPNIHSAIVLKAKGDEENISMGLATLHEEDPTFVYRVDSEVRTNNYIRSGRTSYQDFIERLKTAI
jgi:elongation factor G